MAGLERINSPQTRASYTQQEDREGVIYEPETSRKPEYKTLEQTKAEVAREEAEAARANLHSRFDGPGVEVELSREATRAAEAAREAQTEQSIWDIVKSTWIQIVDMFKAFWTGGEGVGVEDNDSQMDELQTNAIQMDVVQADSTQEGKPQDGVLLEGTKFSPQNEAEDIAAFLVDYGGRKLAKNSDLLTQYDRSGRIVGPSASDRRRILQGEGNVRRY